MRWRERWWPRDWHWYSRFGIEPPFPWVGLAIWTAPVLGVAVGVGAVYLALIFGDDRLANF